MLSITKNKTKSSVSSKESSKAPLPKLVLVYNSRIDSLLKEISVEDKFIDVTNISTDWIKFMNDLNTEMFNKISF
ncbi:MAG: hypothetical protein ACI83B_000790 [Sediminicola sp.]|jgi:hypothetical protein|tara:strand:+ start:840 stop:1064 length:225 start_codon:yes stop_codon:yes gene_type:complete